MSELTVQTTPAYFDWLDINGLKDKDCNILRTLFKNRFDRKFFKKQLTKRLSHYCKQIGIPPQLIPRLIMTRKEYIEVFIHVPFRTNNRNILGQCSRKKRVIFVNINNRIMLHGQYNNPSNALCKRYTNALKEVEQLRVKENGDVTSRRPYFDFENTLVHELVHYRFPILEHGEEFEKEVRAIIGGKTYDASSSRLWVWGMENGRFQEKYE